MLNIVRVTIEGLQGSGKSTIENAISAGTPRGYLVLNAEDYTSEQSMINLATNSEFVDSLVIIKTTTREEKLS